jgi:diadenosine tetraphosphate (Ap4A) HIT family hydrolase
MEDWKRDRIGSCLRGENPMMMVRMKSGFAVMADNQFLPGYCILLRHPRAASLEELSHENRALYLLDTTLIGDAVIKACSPRRINYSTLMNTDGYLHTHIEARYEWEPEEYKYRPSWTYPEKERFTDKYAFSEERHGDLKRKITAYLIEYMKQPGY